MAPTLAGRELGTALCGGAATLHCTRSHKAFVSLLSEGSRTENMESVSTEGPRPGSANPPHLPGRTAEPGALAPPGLSAKNPQVRGPTCLRVALNQRAPRRWAPGSCCRSWSVNAGGLGAWQVKQRSVQRPVAAFCLLQRRTALLCVAAVRKTSPACCLPHSTWGGASPGLKVAGRLLI